jgi:hypothetical protein
VPGRAAAHQGLCFQFSTADELSLFDTFYYFRNTFDEGLRTAKIRKAFKAA